MLWIFLENKLDYNKHIIPQELNAQTQYKLPRKWFQTEAFSQYKYHLTPTPLKRP